MIFLSIPASLIRSIDDMLLFKYPAELNDWIRLLFKLCLLKQLFQSNNSKSFSRIFSMSCKSNSHEVIKEAVNRSHWDEFCPVLDFYYEPFSSQDEPTCITYHEMTSASI